MVTAWCSILPIFTVYMLSLDLIFVLNTTLFAPIGYLLTKCCRIKSLNSLIDGSYERLFQMKPHEVVGFRRMRTITQMIFESVIQLGVQIHMLIYVSLYVVDEDKADFEVNMTSILISVALAVAHILLEYVLLSYEAKACMTNVSNYAIACFNGKFGWVPFANDLTTIAELVDKDSIDEWKCRMLLDFDDIRYSNLFVDCKVPFSFSDAGVSTLCLRVDDLPPEMEH